MRLLAFLGLLALGATRKNRRGPLGLLAFLFVVLAWSLLSVSGTALTAELSPVGEGEGMGLFNATTAVAGVIGSVLGGWIAGRWGYGPALGLAAAGVGCGLILAMTLRSARPQTEHATP
jgi:predicted MFS family arabinose efflux permease